MTRFWQDMRDWTGGEWEGLSAGSRSRLLIAHGIEPAGREGLRWRLLPPSTQRALVDSRVREYRRPSRRPQRGILSDRSQFERIF